MSVWLENRRRTPPIFQDNASTGSEAIKQLLSLVSILSGLLHKAEKRIWRGVHPLLRLNNPLEVSGLSRYAIKLNTL
jgi:hypothetical protein